MRRVIELGPRISLGVLAASAVWLLAILPSFSSLDCYPRECPARGSGLDTLTFISWAVVILAGLSTLFFVALQRRLAQPKPQAAPLTATGLDDTLLVGLDEPAARFDAGSDEQASLVRQPGTAPRQMPRQT